MADEAPRNADLLYHYTSLDAFLSIIENDELWASHVRYLNDTTEQRLVWEQLRAWTQRQQTIVPAEVLTKFQRVADEEPPLNVYVICLSNDGGDRLSQWRGYGGTGGVSIGFNLSGLHGRCTAFLKDKGDDASSKWWCYLDPVTYIGREFNETAWVVIQKHLAMQDREAGIAHERFVRSLQLAAAYLKDRVFQEEQEWRVVVSDLLHINNNVSFRTRRSMVVPYIPFPLGERLWPLIARIVVGPSAWQSETVAALRMKIDPRISVERSAIPYRDW